MRKLLKTFDVDTLLSLHSQGRLDFDISLQREEVWSREKKRNFIYTLINSDSIDIPKLYFREVVRKGEARYEVIDGKQRLLTTFEYVTGKDRRGKTSRLRFDPKNPRFRKPSDALGKKFSELPVPYKTRIRNQTTFDVVVFEGYTDEDLLGNIFYVLQDGDALKPQERRASLNNDFMREVRATTHKHEAMFDRIKLRSRRKEREKVVTYLYALAYDHSITTTKNPVDKLISMNPNIVSVNFRVKNFLHKLDSLTARYGDTVDSALKFNESHIILLWCVFNRMPHWFDAPMGQLKLKNAWDDFHTDGRSEEYNLLTQQGNNQEASRTRRTEIFINYVLSNPKYGLGVSR